MTIKHLLLRSTAPALALAGAAVLFAPAEQSYGFSTLGTALNVGSERDFRIFDNFADAATNNNTTPDANWPGYVGAELALWKAAAEWASLPHGTGGGDPTQNIGDGGANFDFFFGGMADSESAGAQIVSATTGCSPGVFAFVSGGGNSWTMNFCDSQWNWSDGPGGPPGGQIDLQGVGCHEFGHALGLGHSNVGGATMVGSTFNGFEQRSIAGDDQNGVQSIYGAMSSGKPVITGVSLDGSGTVITITGTSFAATGNDVWFTPADPTSPFTDPRIIVSGVASPSGTEIVLNVPVGAGDGDVHVRNNLAGGAGLSNGWPADLQGSSGPSISITAVNPASVESLVPGPAQTVTIQGQGFTASTTVTIDGMLLDPADYTVVNGGTITVDMPQVSTLGSVPVLVEDGTLSDTSSITVVAPITPTLQVGNGLSSASNQITSADTLDVIYAGPPGEFHFVLGSGSNVPSTIAIVSLCLGNNFSDLFETASGIIGAAGYNEVNLPLAPGTFALWYFQDLTFSQGTPIPTSNCQEILILP